MRELHGVISYLNIDAKRHLLLFDRLYVYGEHFFVLADHSDDFFAPMDTDLDFLKSKGLILEIAPEVQNKIRPRFIKSSAPQDNLNTIIDKTVYNAAFRLQNTENDVVPIFSDHLPPVWLNAGQIPPRHLTLSVGLNAMPLPDQLTSLDRILAFKDELRDKHWGFRRFLRNLSIKQQTESEIEDEIEWMVAEYTKAMEVHRLKASKTFFEAYVIPVVEIAEDIAKFNWSKIAKGAVSVKQRKIELLEAELKAPGKECAYVFEARKRFGEK